MGEAASKGEGWREDPERKGGPAMSSSTEYMSTEKRNGQRAAILTGLTAAGGTGAALALARRARRRKRSPAHRAQAMVKKLPDRTRSLPGEAKKLSGQWAKDVSSRMEKMEEQQWRLWGVAAVAITWFLVRMAELRQLRKMNRILISRA
jgi:hypothetical protein